jgi:hypothetical protein
VSVAFLDLPDGTQVLTVPCPVCGVFLAPEDCVEVTTFADAYPRYLPLRCPTPKCGQVCKTCRREPGDVHGPHCWEHMKHKVENPHLVDWSDCR